ncbi:MAG TPA: phospholipase D-like domain-containing protein [Syntrophobacteria bacterium]|nr:phospholipase D-like domain-containing protein [Syntrophobacteria bacterium]
MRNRAKSEKGLEVRGVAGTFVVLLAFNCAKDYCKGLLGFGIQRKDHENGEVTWLRGLKKFDLPGADDGDDVSTRHHPIQKFHWGDYTTKPGRTYTYTVHAMHGQPGALVDFDSVAVEVKCETSESVGRNGHAVHFNRSAAASQAFARRFPRLPEGDVEDPNARIWLSRGLAESLIAFIDAAKAGEGLHLFLYEFEKEEFFQALKQAQTRGVKLEILYDALLDTKGEGPSLRSKPQIEKFGLGAVCKGRTGKGLNISHNKFMVLTGTSGKPQAVWTGSTNFTDSAIYGQSNVGHAIVNPDLAGVYLDWHQAIWKAPDESVADSRNIVDNLTTVPALNMSGTTLVLSPRKTIEAVTECARLVAAGKRMVCFTAPFAVHDDLEEALANTPAHVFGLLNKDNVVGKALHEARNTQLAAAGAINEKSILEAWQGKLQAESMHHSGVFIHTKIILVDPLSDNPIVITGSANFSNNSSKNNDENQLFIAGETEVADVYLGEFMRMFDHYYFRDHLEMIATQRQTNPKAGFLDATDAWTDRFFDGGEREALRLAFFD